MNAGVSYILLRSNLGRLSASGGASQGIYYNSQGLANGLSGSLSGSYRLGEQWFLGGGFSISYGYFNHVKTSTSKSYSVSASMSGREIPTRLSLAYSFAEPRSITSPTLDTNRHSISLSGSQQLTPRDSVSISYSFLSSENLDPFGSNFAYRSNGMSLSYYRQITKDLSGYLGVNGNYINYSNPDSVTLFQQFRTTRQYSISGGLNLPLSDQVNFGLSYSYTKSSTNIHVTSAQQQSLNEILSSPIPIVGGDYAGRTISVNYSVAF